MKAIWITAVFLMGCVCIAGQQPASQHRLADSLQRKLDHIQENAKSAQPDQTPTVMTEEEFNDYFAAGRVKLPQGVKRVTFQGQSGVLTALAIVDFDQIRAGEPSSNALLSMFSGTHNVRVESDAAGSNGQGKIHVRNVSIDGIDVPPMALEFFINEYLKPKYPNVGMDSEFSLPDRIDVAIIGYHKLTVTQK
ncbi:MAG TPA: hypothetical protein VK699_17580 [Terriglobales bacterium]|jgi:hypothetical protein|nr:hypothetical protein [Terriglobales bacterium]